jgi:hypothetical protein
MKYNNRNGNILGQYFNFFKFLRVILKVADIGYERLERVNPSNINYSNNYASGNNILNSSASINQMQPNFNVIPPTKQSSLAVILKAVFLLLGNYSKEKLQLES